MSYQILFSPKSRKQIKALKDKKLKDRIRNAIIEIGKDPWHRGTIKVERYENIRRKRVGRYRILYMVDKQRKEILIVKIEKRTEGTYQI